MIRVAFVLLLSTSIFVSCNDNTQLKKENNQLKAENEKLKSLVDSLTNTPQSMYSSAINSF